MRPRLFLPFIAFALFAVTGCDLMSDPDGPRPEDFEVQEETSEVRATEAAAGAAEDEVPRDVALPLPLARGGVALRFTAPR